MQNFEDKQELKIAKIICTIIIALCVLFLIIILIIAINLSHKKITNFLGYKLTIAVDSSQNTFNIGDLLIIKKAEEKELRGGDIISFWNENKNELITHKVEDVIIGEDGRKQYITTNDDKSNIVSYSQIEGKYVGRIKNLGNVMNGILNPFVIIAIILIPIVIYILVCRHKIKREDIKNKRREKLLKKIAEKDK